MRKTRATAMKIDTELLKGKVVETPWPTAGKTNAIVKIGFESSFMGSSCRPQIEPQQHNISIQMDSPNYFKQTKIMLKTITLSKTILFRYDQCTIFYEMLPNSSLMFL